jgi:hypothetical protein
MARVMGEGRTIKRWKVVAVLIGCLFLLAAGCNLSDDQVETVTPRPGGGSADTGMSQGEDVSSTGDVAGGDEDALNGPDDVNSSQPEDTSGEQDASETDSGNDDVDPALLCETAANGTPCDATVVGSWGACEYDPDDVCTLDGEKSRIDTVHVCEAGQCVTRQETVTESCSDRITQGTTCGDTTIGRPTTCVRTNEETCSSQGAQIVTRIHFRCDAAGACTPEDEQLSQLCTVNPDGMFCGVTGLGICNDNCCEGGCATPPCLACPQRE